MCFRFVLNKAHGLESLEVSHLKCGEAECVNLLLLVQQPAEVKPHIIMDIMYKYLVSSTVSTFTGHWGYTHTLTQSHAGFGQEGDNECAESFSQNTHAPW